MTTTMVRDTISEVVKARGKKYEVIFDFTDAEAARVIAYKFWNTRRTLGLVTTVGVSLDRAAKTVRVFKA